MSAIKEQLSSIVSCIDARIESGGLESGIEMDKATAPILIWLHWYRTHRPPLAAQDLLPGIHASVLEAIAYVSMGLGRAALTAIRMQIDLILSFGYFKDHPIEWKQVTVTGEGFMLRNDVYGYHKDVDKQFASRLATIEGKSNISLETLYKRLSAHIHGQSVFTVPDTKKVQDLVWSTSKIETVTRLQEQVSLAISNFLLAVNAKDWTDLPQSIVTEARNALGEKQKDFFS